LLPSGCTDSGSKFFTLHSSLFTFYSSLFTFYSSLFILCSSLLVSCGIDNGLFRLEGEFKSFNQGEFYVYTTDGPTHQLDTIQVRAGRFVYEVPLEMPTTFVLVFPNFSELPVFGESGKVVKIEGDASHLKETTVSGTDTNKAMTAFRMQTNEQTPPEAKNAAAQFIQEHPQSPASRYILNKYFIQTLTPDYDKALELVDIIAKESPADKQLNTLRHQLKGLKHLKDNGTLPPFTATDINGKTASNSDLTGAVNVINVWASWNYDSQNMLRKLKRLQTDYGQRLKVVSSCLDADQRECRKFLDRDSIKWNCVCDGRMWETPLLTHLGLYFVPDNIITDSRGKIIAHSLPTNEIDRKIEELLR